MSPSPAIETSSEFAGFNGPNIRVD
jgi:hypothetical protein